jgi:hypothetical protein
MAVELAGQVFIESGNKEVVPLATVQKVESLPLSPPQLVITVRN